MTILTHAILCARVAIIAKVCSIFRGGGQYGIERINGIMY
jgi:hypothetical protein